jgi:heme iron utilization protein
VAIRDHGSAGAAPSAAERARTIAAAANCATLATLTGDGDPWASFVAYGLLGGAPVLCVSNLAEHGRNLAGDQRASLSIVAASGDADPLASSRITLAGKVVRPADSERDAVASAYANAVPNAGVYLGFSDFTLWVLGVERVRWVGGYGRMDSATGEQYLAATPDPITPASAAAITHLNDDHADDLAAMARAFGGHPDADSAVCTGIDRYGLDLWVHTPRGEVHTRVAFFERLDSTAQLRWAARDLAHAARAG